MNTSEDIKIIIIKYDNTIDEKKNLIFDKFEFRTKVFCIINYS